MRRAFDQLRARLSFRNETNGELSLETLGPSSPSSPRALTLLPNTIPEHGGALDVDTSLALAASEANGKGKGKEAQQETRETDKNDVEDEEEKEGEDDKEKTPTPASENRKAQNRIQTTQIQIEKRNNNERKQPYTPRCTCARKLETGHYACYIQHRHMRMAKNFEHSLPCMTCFKTNQAALRWCPFCGLRICKECTGKLVKCKDRSLKELMDGLLSLHQGGGVDRGTFNALSA